MTNEEVRYRVGATEDGGGSVPMNLDIFLDWYSTPYRLQNPESDRNLLESDAYPMDSRIRQTLNKHDGYCGFMAMNQMSHEPSRSQVRLGIEELIDQLPGGLAAAKQRAELQGRSLYPVLHIGCACRKGRHRANETGEGLAEFFRDLEDVAEVVVINHHLRTRSESYDLGGCGCREGRCHLLSKIARGTPGWAERLNTESAQLRKEAAGIFAKLAAEVFGRTWLEERPRWPQLETPRVENPAAARERYLQSVNAKQKSEPSGASSAPRAPVREDGCWRGRS